MKDRGGFMSDLADLTSAGLGRAINKCMEQYRHDPSFLDTIPDKITAFLDDGDPARYATLKSYGQRLLNALYGQIYQEADTLYRGLAECELQNLLTYGTFGSGKRDVEWSRFTVIRQVGVSFADDYQGALIEFPKHQAYGHLIHQGYAVCADRDSEYIKGPKVMRNFEEQEHRLPKDTIHYSVVDMTITFWEVNDRESYINEYDVLGKIRFE